MICENVKLFLSQKSQFNLVEKIKNKNRSRASLFQSSEDGKQEIYFMWPYVNNTNTKNQSSISCGGI